MLRRFLNLIYPPKCVLCQRILDPNVTDLCHSCRINAREFTHGKRNIPFVAQWTALWYYKDDVATWIPIGPWRNFRRGYDQAQLICQNLQKETGCQIRRFLKKIRNAPPQSGLADAARRRANVLGAYKAVNPALLEGKRILLLDDVITTGATASECARILLTAGAKSVTLAAVAAARQDKI